MRGDDVGGCEGMGGFNEAAGADPADAAAALPLAAAFGKLQ